MTIPVVPCACSQSIPWMPVAPMGRPSVLEHPEDVGGGFTEFLEQTLLL